MTYLLDTNVLSETRKRQPAAAVAGWIAATPPDRLHVSVLTLGEIRKGLAILPQSKRRTQLETWLEVELRARFSGRILPIDAGVSDRWGLLAAEATRRGKTLATIDALLAATAFHFNLTIVSRNANDFAATSVPLLNPWEA